MKIQNVSIISLFIVSFNKYYRTGNKTKNYNIPKRVDDNKSIMKICRNNPS